MNRKLCVFIHYGRHSGIPGYVEIYLKELSRFFDQILLVSNHDPKTINLKNLPANTRLLSVVNEGYDFGMFYKAMQTIDLQEYRQIGCINDSNVLFNQLGPVMEWGENSKLDLWGLIDSHQRPWFSSHSDNYHIQSHFLIFNKRALEKLPAFFQALDLRQLFQEKNQKKLRQKIIDKWEIGLSQFLIKEGLKVGSFVSSEAFSLRHRIKKPGNLSHKYYIELIEAGYPLIKKKIIFENSFWKRLFRQESKWENLLLQYGHPDWNIRETITELKQLKKQ